jgi:hypothetical protein
VGAAVVGWCIVLILGIIPVVIGAYVTAENGGSVVPSSMLLRGMDKVLPDINVIGVLLVNVEAIVLTEPLHLCLLVLVLIALFGLMDIDAVHPIAPLLGESNATMSANVFGGASNEPSVIIAVITGTGVDVVVCVSLQSYPSLGAHWYV